MSLRTTLAFTYVALMIVCGVYMLQGGYSANCERHTDDPNEQHRLYRLREQMMFADPNTGKIPSNLRAREMAYYYEHLYSRPTRSHANWFSAGPWNVGGRTRALAIDRSNENIFIAAGVSGGIYRTTNSGKSWTLVSDTVSHQGIISLCQDARIGYENLWYAVGGEASGNSAGGGGSYYLGDGVFKSMDSGKSWQPIVSTALGNAGTFSTELQVCWRIISSPRADTPAIFLATYGFIFRSLDGGNTFALCLGNANSSSYYSDVVSTSTGILYATLSSDGSSKGFFRSADNGTTWTNILDTTLLKNYERTVMGVNPNNENEVYFFSHLPDSSNKASVRTGNFQDDQEWISLLSYTYINGDGAGAGGKWQDKSQALPASYNTTTGKFDRLNVQGGYDMYVKVQPVTGTVFIAGTNIFRSTNAFANASTTKQIGGYAPGTGLPNFGVYPNHHPDCHDLLFFTSNPNKLLCASDGGVHLCLNSAAENVVWQSCNNGYLTTQPYTVTLDPSRYSAWLLSGFQDNGNYVTTNFRQPQQRWTMPFNGDGAYNYIAKNKDFFIMSTQEGKVGIFKLDEQGRRIQRRRIDPVGPSNEDYVFINPLAVDPDDDNTLYLPAGKSIWRYTNLRSIDINDSWEKLSTGWYKLPDTITTPNTSGGSKAQITAIAVSRKKTNVVYIGTSNRDIFRIVNANTNAPTMTKLTKAPLPSSGTGIGASSAFVSSICIDDEDAGKIIVVYSNYGLRSIFSSVDSGKTFQLCGGNLDRDVSPSLVAPSIRSIDMFTLPNGTKHYFAATSIGLYSTTMLRPGATASKDSTVWMPEASGTIGTTVCNFVTHRSVDFTVAVSTHGKGTFVREYYNLAEDSLTHTDMVIFPNPMSNFGNIKLDNWGAATATLTLYSMQGAVAYRNNYSDLTGERDLISFTTNTLARGAYIVEMHDGNKKRIVKKIVLLP